MMIQTATIAAQPAVRRRSSVLVVWAASALLLAACAAPFPVGRDGMQNIIVGQDRLTAQDASLPDQPALPRSQAVTIAKGYVPTWQQASAVTARYVALTLHANTGKVAWGVQNRPVWLVEFAGARYAPPAYPESDCACDRTFQPPNTAVAVDAQTGALVIDYGFPAGGAS